MAWYIDREVVLNILSQKNAPWDGYQRVADLRIADVVSKAAYDQVVWERNLAKEQLKSIGKSLGEKMDDVQPVKHGKNLDREIPSIFSCSVCGWHSWDTYCGDTSEYNYCPHCGAKMDGGT